MSITSENVYSWRDDMRRYHLEGSAIGALHPLDEHEWSIRFTRPQPSSLLWTDLHTPAILAEYTFVAGSADDADVFAKIWLEGEHNRYAFGDEIADIINDYFTFAAATHD